jgi:hypothetical protein
LKIGATLLGLSTPPTWRYPMSLRKSAPSLTFACTNQTLSHLTVSRER